MSCELTPDLKRSPIYNVHTASKRPNTKLLFERSSRTCIKLLHKADLKNNVLIVMLVLCLQRVMKMARNLLQSVLWPPVLRVCDKEPKFNIALDSESSTENRN